MREQHVFVVGLWHVPEVVNSHENMLPAVGTPQNNGLENGLVKWASERLKGFNFRGTGEDRADE